MAYSFGSWKSEDRVLAGLGEGPLLVSEVCLNLHMAERARELCVVSS